MVLTIIKTLTEFIQNSNMNKNTNKILQQFKVTKGLKSQESQNEFIYI